MKECLNCKNQYQERRSTSKFCSNKCRAAFARKNEKYGQESLLSKVLLVQEELTDTLLKIKQLVANTPYNAPKLPVDFVGDEPLHPANTRPILIHNTPAKIPASNEVIQKQIDEIKKEKIPKERDTINGRKAWALDQKKRIEELEKQIK